MELWRIAFRAFVPSLPQEGLVALREAAQSNDPDLLQGQTTLPPAFSTCQDWPCEGGCAVSYAFWRGGLVTVGEVEEAFAQACYEADVRLKEPAGCRHWLNRFDEGERTVVLAELLVEVEFALGLRGDPVE